MQASMVASASVDGEVGSGTDHVGREPSSRVHIVAMLATEHTPAVELAVPSAIFGAPQPDVLNGLGSLPPWYEVRVCSAGPDAAHGVLERLEYADTILVCGAPGIPPDAPSAARCALRSAHARGCRIVGIGSGVLLLAAAGVLTGRRATAHWSVIGELHRRYPDVLVESSVLYTADGEIHTSAGAAATLDLCLELVRIDHGVAVANSVARWMVAPPHRAGELPQYMPSPLGKQGDGIAQLLDWASARLDQPLALADLAQAAGVSQRTVIRRFHAAVGTTPLQWLLAQRIRLAQELLESTQCPVEQIAELSGLGTPGNFRQQFTRARGVSPQRYRREFRRRGVQHRA